MKDLKVINPATGKYMVLNMEGYLCPQKLEEDSQYVADEKVIPFDTFNPQTGTNEYNSDVVKLEWLPAELADLDDEE
jgi:hypothetical protein